MVFIKRIILVFLLLQSLFGLAENSKKEIIHNLFLKINNNFKKTSPTSVKQTDGLEYLQKGIKLADSIENNEERILLLARLYNLKPEFKALQCSLLTGRRDIIFDDLENKITILLQKEEGNFDKQEEIIIFYYISGHFEKAFKLINNINILSASSMDNYHSGNNSLKRRILSEAIKCSIIEGDLLNLYKIYWSSFDIATFSEICFLPIIPIWALYKNINSIAFWIGTIIEFTLVIFFIFAFLKIYRKRKKRK